MTADTPEVLRWNLVSINVCVPSDYTDEQVERFMNTEHPTGVGPWTIKHELGRVTCEGNDRRVHIVGTC